jgi:hypothetical protein
MWRAWCRQPGWQSRPSCVGLFNRQQLPTELLRLHVSGNVLSALSLCLGRSSAGRNFARTMPSPCARFLRRPYWKTGPDKSILGPL